jgi:holliday junction DNA helicase RuvA
MALGRKWYDSPYMIRSVRGTVLSIDPAGAVVDVSGWGAYLYMPNAETLTEGQSVTLHTHLAVKQDGIDLYGFTADEDLRFFEHLLSVSGVGPKTALSIQRRAPRENLMEAIGKRDIGYLTRVAGLGKKAAEKLAVELSEKIGVQSGGSVDDADGEVIDTLIALGYTEREARKALASVSREVEGKEARLKAALSGKS